MGCIDSITQKLTCKECNVEDTVKALEKGSSYSSSWGGYSGSNQFDLKQEQKNYGPAILSAMCKKCKCEDITIEII